MYNVGKRWLGIFTFLVFIMTSPVNVYAAQKIDESDLGNILPLYSCVPFIGMLLSLALISLIAGEWWEKNKQYVVIFWCLLFIIPFGIKYGAGLAIEQVLESIIGDYITFIVLLFGLFCVAGNIELAGDLKGNPKMNTLIIFLGAALSSWIGTTGSSMILIRPLIKSNRWRGRRKHIIIFFIFLVSNIGGCLTPVGDPPLLMGFMRGVPFFWSLELFPVWATNVALLLLIFYVIDSIMYKKDMKDGIKPPHEQGKVFKPIRLVGAHNIIFLVVIVTAVILSGVLPSLPAFIDDQGAVKGIHIFGEVTFTYPAIIEIAIILTVAFLSFKTTKKEIREANNFTWGAIEEVAILFVGIFITMIPALLILKSHGAALGLDKPAELFWITGALSSFLDNTPTYLVFMTAASTLGAKVGIDTTLGIIAQKMLMAVSCGAVFMGANTYIGNAPNLMVRSIAEENGIKMPSFFGYLLWSVACLIPVFLIDMLVFFM
ncbi:Na+/H+ antiporter NhaD [Acetitomaculum ruminis DSM 5522]|uniref:Na+/H+ antiporter NhaD n=1 Tax=Acetitomaculum ruminis DSM 5522 TaxID=1120918 RepID=A0A1I0XZ28_9FIRM|nr:sodium:proton antiporter [Acetitomaculum ruminis]SFB06321.1 Na+/H+ antiporter NhaD [Acetitomaculum ruminis DSM 5522]